MEALAGSRYWGVGGRRCGACGVSPAAVHCRSCPAGGGGGAYLCAGCDAGPHHARAGHGHVRVWVCEVCERAPAAVTCRADAAALCAACDADIHDANPLARRHERLPVQPIGAAASAAVHNAADAEALLFGPTSTEEKVVGVEAGNKQQMDFLFADVMADPFLAAQEDFSARFLHADSVVPNNNGSSGGGGGVDHFEFGGGVPAAEAVAVAAVKPSYSSYTAASLGHSGSSSEVGLVPDAMCGGRGGSVTGGVIELDFAQSKAAYLPYASTPTHSMSSLDVVGAVPDQRSDVTMAGSRVVAIATTPGAPAVESSREARLMRYREKRKNRRFDKTIRYASRKAYAESRPRIKGRFAKRADDVDNDAGDGDADFFDAAPVPVPVPAAAAARSSLKPHQQQQQQQQPSYPYVLDFAAAGYGVVPTF